MQQTTTRNRATVLAVDENPAVLLLIQSILTANNYRVLLARSRTDAVNLVMQKHIHINLALLDVHITGVFGTELAEEMTAARSDLRVLWMSNTEEDGFLRIRLVAGEDGLLQAVERALAGEPAAKPLAAGASRGGE